MSVLLGRVMGWTLGSESRERADTDPMPAGTGHAVDGDARETACGRPVRSLHLWPDVPWRRVRMLGLSTCPACDRGAE